MTSRIGGWLGLVLFLAASFVVVQAGPVRGDDQLARKARTVLRKYCLDCHGGTEGTKAGLRVLDYGQLVDQHFFQPGKPDASELFELAEVGSMPPGNLPFVAPDDLQVLQDWIKEGGSPFPPEVGEPYILDRIEENLEVLRKADEGADVKQLPYQRYISFNHLLLYPDSANTSPDVWREALTRVLNHLSLKSTSIRPIPLDEPTGTLFRIDVRELGWHEKPFEIRKPATKPGEPPTVPSPMTYWDLVLLEYPYATLPDLTDPSRPLLREYLQEIYPPPGNPIAPVLYIRGDWFVRSVTQSPLYEDLLRLPGSLADLEKQLEVATLPGEKDHRQLAGFTSDGPGGIRSHFVQRQPSKYGDYWKRWDVQEPGSLVEQARKLAKIPTLAASGQALFRLPNGLDAFYLFDREGQRRQDLPGQETTPEHREVGASLGCILCHQQGVVQIPNAGMARQALEGANLAEPDRERLLELFPTATALNAQIEKDQQEFLQAGKKILGHDWEGEPLRVVSEQYRQWAPPEGDLLPVQWSLAREREELKKVYAQMRYPGPPPEPGPTLLPRDAITFLQQSPVHADPRGAPVRDPLPISMTPEKLTPGGIPIPNPPFFVPGDHMQIRIRNEGKEVLHFELVVRTMSGSMGDVVAVTELPAGKEFLYPLDNKAERTARGFVTIELPYGKDWYTLYAAETPFPGGVRHQRPRGSNVGERIVHPFYTWSEDKTRILTSFDPSRLTRKTVEVRTAPPGR